MRSHAVGLALAIVLAPFGARAADLVVWWEKGYYAEEDEAVADIVAAFEHGSGQQADLVVYPEAELPDKTVAALEARAPPDFAFGLEIADFISEWAFDDRLVDLSDASGSFANLFDPNALNRVTLLDGRTGQRVLYALPIGISTNHIHLWKSLLVQAGFTPADVPKDWNAFWSFWCDQVQPAVRRVMGREDIWGVGLPMSVENTDSWFQFLQLVAAYQADYVTPEGQLVIDDPGVRGKLIEAIENYTAIGVWLARQANGRWSAPVPVVYGLDRFGRAQPCWNPVLYQPTAGPPLLFYKVGPSPRRWWGMMCTSADSGATWATPRRLPRGILGPLKNKPVALPGGAILCPSSTEHLGWRVHLECTPDLGKTWCKVGPLNDRRELGAIQPCILTHADRRVQILCRTRQGIVASCWSADGGHSWSPMTVTSLPNPDIGIDAVALRDGRAVLVYNPSRQARTPLSLAVSEDGHTWRDSLVLEDAPGEYSYPAVFQGTDGNVQIAYTRNRRRIRHASVAPDEL